MCSFVSLQGTLRWRRRPAHVWSIPLLFHITPKCQLAVHPTRTLSPRFVVQTRTLTPFATAVAIVCVQVLSYVDVLRGRAEVGRRVAVIGAGGIGFDVSEYLLGDKALETPPEERLQDASSFLKVFLRLNSCKQNARRSQRLGGVWSLPSNVCFFCFVRNSKPSTCKRLL